MYELNFHHLKKLNPEKKIDKIINRAKREKISSKRFWLFAIGIKNLIFGGAFLVSGEVHYMLAVLQFANCKSIIIVLCLIQVRNI